ncbi:MAG: acyl-ACP--UDP-N-acetylglucosamine O-acyltransferase [Verrucomicrobia bacterium]|nr:acyl-ACP--UDP-N-acetylglucosamine O-acyltransferase [Verrucomicrobiota bacterium]
MIHPTACIHPGARIGAGTVAGPFAVVDADVTLGEQCVLGPHVHLTGHTVIGRGNRFHAGSVIGDAPQDAKYAGGPTRLRIGDGNVFREHVTVHRSNQEAEDTVIGDRNFLMAGSHVGHNCRIGSDNILANGALLAGHVTVADRVFISGNCVVHQFCRIGRLAMMQGGAAISLDLPPFCIARGDNGISGLNVVGLRRAGISASDRLLLRRAYHALFRFTGRRAEALVRVRSQLGGHPLVEELLQFVESTRRGICPAIGRAAPADAPVE